MVVRMHLWAPRRLSSDEAPGATYTLQQLDEASAFHDVRRDVRPGASFAAEEPKSKPSMSGCIRRSMDAPPSLQRRCGYSDGGTQNGASVRSPWAPVDRSTASHPLLVSRAVELEHRVSAHRSELTSDGSTA